ncbi:hypothetical protein JCM24511_09291 [Saitozyma sp. JCM 24511]|nr:hypothetical protein JCM24511_09291 [Saitozyma sp. JCM 24511]
MSVYDAAESCASSTLTDYQTDTATGKTQNFAVGVAGNFWLCYTDISSSTAEPCSTGDVFVFYVYQV